MFDPTNGITLCARGRRSCHKLITGEELLWAPVLTKIVDENIWGLDKIIPLVEQQIGPHPLLDKLKGEKLSFPKRPKKGKIRLHRHIKKLRSNNGSYSRDK